jgi:hypothetical protein
MRIQALLFGCILYSPPFCLVTEAEQPTPHELLNHWQQRQEYVENLSIDAEWEEFSNGRITEVSRQNLMSDRLGRLRIVSTAGLTGQNPREFVELYNGECTVTIDDDPSRNRLGQTHTAETIAKQERFLAANINDGLGIDGKGPFARRNPFTFESSWVGDTVKMLLEKESSVEVLSVEGESGVFELRFKYPPEDVAHQLQHICRIDEDMGWVITTHERRDAKTGKPIGLAKIEYQLDDNGVWLPRSGFSRRGLKSDTSEPPDLEWSFKVQKIRLNDPDFDDRLFDICLKPGTYVNDNRTGSVYWVGSEGAIGDQLVSLAQEAAARDAASFEQLKPKPAAAVKLQSRFMFGLLLTGNLVVFSVLLIAWWVRRKRQ